MHVCMHIFWNIPSLTSYFNHVSLQCSALPEEKAVRPDKIEITPYNELLFGVLNVLCSLYFVLFLPSPALSTVTLWSSVLVSSECDLQGL